MITVILSFPNRHRETVVLPDVPGVGDSVRLARNGSGTPTLIVEHRLWMEGNDLDPGGTVVLVVRPTDNVVDI